MFAVQPNNAGKVQGKRRNRWFHTVNRKFYDHIVEELESIEKRKRGSSQ